MDNRNVYADALRTWGAEAQTKMLFEEIGELMQAVCKAGRVKSWEQRVEVWRNIAEEIADVKIMLGEMELLFDVEDAVEVCKKEKITRLAKRLKAAHARERTDICDVKGASYTRHSANQAKTGPWWTVEKDGRGINGYCRRPEGCKIDNPKKDEIYNCDECEWFVEVDGDAEEGEDE